MTMTLASAAFGCSTRPTELDWDGLRCAARTYFPNGRGVSPTAKGELDTAFYVGLDLAQRAQAWTVADRRLHAAAFNALRRYIPPRISTPFDEHRRMVVAGCGDGRLARAYIRAAAHLGMDELVFNDLHAFQVEATRHVVARLPLDRAPPRITFLAGDYASLAPDLPADLVVALFFVVPEITDLSSAAALRHHRHRFFSAVANSLRPGGLFVEDTPEVDLPGFYADLRRRSRRVLVGHGVEPALAENLELTCLPGWGCINLAM